MDFLLGHSPVWVFCSIVLPGTYFTMAICWFIFGTGKRMKWMPGMRYRVIKEAGSQYYVAQQRSPLWPFWVKCNISNFERTEHDSWKWLTTWLKGDMTMGGPVDKKNVRVMMKETEDEKV